MKRRTLLSGLVSGLGLSAHNVAVANDGPDDEVVLVGQSAAKTGPAAMLGIGMEQGISACFTAVNAAGGVRGRKIQLVSLDDGYEPERAAANTIRLLEHQRVYALLGYVGTPTANAVLPIVSRAGVPFVGALTGAATLRTPLNPWVINVRASYMDEGPAIVRQLMSFSDKPSVGLFLQRDAYGQAVQASIERALAEVGLRPTAIGWVERNSFDVAQAVDTLARANITALAGGSVAGASIALLKGLHARGCYPMFVSVSFIGTSAVLSYGEQAQGIGIAQVMPPPTSTSLPIVREYQDAIALTGAHPGYESLEGYAAARTFVLGLERSGPRMTREGFIRGLEAMGRHDFGGLSIEYSSLSHNGSRKVDLAMVGQGGHLYY